jgi:spore germination protein GerM
MSRRALILTVTVAAILAVAIIYLRDLERHISPAAAGTQTSEQRARTRLSEAALQQAGGQKQTLTLYFPSYADGKLVPESRSLSLASEDTKRIQQVLLALIEGSHQGHGNSLPPSATIRAAFLLQDGTAVVDLSREALSDFSVGIESETLAVYSIVDSLAANIPAVKRVKFLVDGQEVQTLDGHVDLTGYFVPEPALITQITQAP